MNKPPVLPTPLALAVRLMYAGAALTVLALALDLLTADAQRGIVQQEYAATHPGSQLSGAGLDAAVKVAVVSLIIGATIRLLLWLWMAWKNGQGRPWARIVGTVFCVINLFSYTYLGREAVGPQVITVIDMALGLVITVLLWLRVSSQHYAQQAHRKHGAARNLALLRRYFSLLYTKELDAVLELVDD